MPLEELKEIADCIEGIPDYAQKAWIREFGLENVLKVVPNAVAAWNMTQPRSTRTGLIVPLVLYIRNCLKNEYSYPTREPENRGLDLKFLEGK